MQTHSLSLASSTASSSPSLVPADNAEPAAPSNAAPTLHAPTNAAPSHFSAMPAPAPDPVYDNDEDDDEDMAAWVTSLVQTVTETDVTRTHALQKCFRDLDHLRDALSRGATLEADPAAASGLARALRDLLQALVRHVQAGVVDLHMAGPDMICDICSGPGLLAELYAARLIGKSDQASLPTLLGELSAALARTLRDWQVRNAMSDRCMRTAQA